MRRTLAVMALIIGLSACSTVQRVVNQLDTGPTTCQVGAGCICPAGYTECIPGDDPPPPPPASTVPCEPGSAGCLNTEPVPPTIPNPGPFPPLCPVTPAGHIPPAGCL
jgi:hypothetical protein